MGRGPMQITTLRLPREMIELADALIEHVARIPEVSAGGEVLRSDVLRLALARGLADLRTESTTNNPARGRARQRR